MRKETVNTFTKGMVTDSHPLTTPADILTDCLNGTVITYNGNEMILQNDMGNTQIGSAKLPDGYIPVGMTEYGGIIYVASYNPETKCGQIGSFPSPQQKFLSSEWNVNDDNDNLETLFNLSAFYDGEGYISNTQLITPIGEGFILHTGDRFKVDGINNLLNLQAQGSIKINFGILKSDGTIELLDDSCVNTNPQIYRGKSSGTLMIIIKLLTIEKFNLVRKYKRNETNPENIDVTFKAEIIPEEGANGTLYLRNLLNNTSNASLEVTIPDNSSSVTLPYSFCPEIEPQGIMKSMSKSGYIDFSKFKGDRLDIKDWSYFITDNYIKLNWSLDYYALDDDKQIQVVYFNFYSLENTSVPIYTEELIKENFNGSFEEIIGFDDIIKRNNIYIVKILYKLGDSYDTAQATQDSGFKRVIYTSGLLNEYYGKVKDFTNKGFNDANIQTNMGTTNIYYSGVEIGEVTLDIKITPTIENVNANDYRPITITDPYQLETTYKSYKDLTAATFISNPDQGGNLGMYSIAVVNNYRPTVNITTTQIIDSKYEGFISNAKISAILAQVINNLSLTFDQSGIERYGDDIHVTHTALQSITTPLNTTVPENNVNDRVLTYEAFQDTRNATIKTTETKSKVVTKQGLRPMYYSEMKNTMKDKVFSCWNKNKLNMASGSDDADIHYGSTLAGAELVKGVNTGSGCDDAGLNTAMEYMGLPMVSIFAGCNGQEARYSPSSNAFTVNNYYRNPNLLGWNSSDNEIDTGDNWLMAIWKQTDNRYTFTCLASQRVYQSTSGQLIRLDYMLRCLLSQLFVKQMFKETVYFIAINNDTLTYNEGEVTLIPQVNESNFNTQDWNQINNYDLMYDTTSSVKGKIWDFNDNNEEFNNWALTINFNVKPVIHYDTVSFGSDFYMDYITNVLNTSEYESQTESTDDFSVDKIYIPNWSNISDNDYSFNSDKSINWKIKDFTGKVIESPDNADGQYDRLKTWDKADWMFKQHFGHVLTTTCALNATELEEGELNEVLLKTDVDSLESRTGYWRKNKDNNAPDIRALLENTYNSIYIKAG